MNYRHAYHAGNFADVMKHVLLARMLAYLQRKPAPFFALDTHGGLGVYDLGADEATRTLEWRNGIGRMDAPFAPEVEALLAPWRACVADTRARFGAAACPGSPLVIASLLRPGDRGLAVELHPADFESLKHTLEPVPHIRALHLDGWMALHANIPPKEKRGLVIIDPPYEKTGELMRASDEIIRALRKWAIGTIALWYPIKDTAAVDAAAERLADSGLRRLLRLDLYIDANGPPDRLNGCGLIIANPPWPLLDEARLLLPALAGRLAGERGAARCEWIVGE